MEPDGYTLDDICGELRPRKQGAGNLRVEIERTIEIAKAMQTFPKLSASQVRAQARAAQKALAILQRAQFPAEVTDVLRPYEVCFKAIGPDKRFDFFKWACAYRACVLIGQFSLKPPAATPSGNIHNISRIIFWFVTHEHTSEKSGLLRACRSALAHWKSDQSFRT